MDYTLVQQLRVQVADQLRDARRQRELSGLTAMGPDDERIWARSVIRQILTSHRQEQLALGIAVTDPAEDAQLAEAVHAALFGLGRLQPLINDPDLLNIEIVGHDQVWLTHREFGVVPGEPVAESDQELIDWVRNVATYSGLSSRQFDPTNPFLDVRLPDGSRLNATMAVVERPVISVRLFRRQEVRLVELRRRDSFGADLESFLTAAVRARFNIMVSGETFAGKTTLLRALGNEIGPEERLVTAEHFHELGFHLLPHLHPQVVAMEERLSNTEGQGAITVHDLVDRSRRMNPDRIIVGEVVGGEVIAMLDAMTQGNDGSLSTIHARDPRQVFDRIATYALRCAERLPVEASYRLAAGGLDFVVHMAKVRWPDGRPHRFVSSVLEVCGFDGVQVVTSEVFAAGPGRPMAVPAAQLTESRALRLVEHGYDDRAWALAVAR
ncbi:MAG: Flp pilus assembly complex ATPase component TadA [Sporichthyaceae bacterium]|nr:Flp pilus assembly complex ATPase component TadA [Sporichthyaceae bacterium]